MPLKPEHRQLLLALGIAVGVGAAGALTYFLCLAPAPGAPGAPAAAQRGARPARAPKQALEEAVAAFLATSSVAELAAAIRELRSVGAAVAELGDAEGSAATTPTSPLGSGGGGGGAAAAPPPSSPAAASRTWVTAELVKVCAYAACVRGEEDGERLCSALVQLALLGVLSPAGLEHGLRVMAARLSDVVLDHPAALVHLTGFATWLAQSEAVWEGCLEAGALPAGSLRAALRDSCVEDPARARAGMAALAGSLTARLRSRQPTQLSQLRAMYREAVEAYLASGGGALEAMVDALNGMRAQWTLHELVRKLCHAFLDPPCASAAAEAGAEAPQLPPWLLRELTADLLCALVQRGLLDATAIVAGLEATLRELPEIALDVPGAPLLMGALVARLCAEGALPADYIAGKHSSLEGDTLEGAGARAARAAGASSSSSAASSAGPNPSPLGASPALLGGSASPTASSPVAPAPAAAAPAPLPAVMNTPALGPLPRNAWAAGISAKRQTSYGSTSSSPVASPSSAAAALAGSPEGARGGGGGAAAASAATSPAPAAASTWESQAPEAGGLEDEDFSLGDSASAAGSSSSSSTEALPGSAASGAPQPPAPLTALRSAPGVGAAGLPAAPPLTRTVSSRRRAVLTGSSSGGGGSDSSSSSSSSAGHALVLQALTCAASYTGAPSATDRHLQQRMRALDIWGTRSAAGDKHHTVTDLRAACHAMAHGFALSVMHELHTEDFPVLTPHVAASHAVTATAAGGSAISSCAPPAAAPAPPPAPPLDASPAAAERAFFARLAAFGPQWARAMGSNAVYYLASVLVRTSGAVALAELEPAFVAEAAGAAAASAASAAFGALGPRTLLLPPSRAPRAKAALAELTARTLSLCAALVATGALPAGAVRAGLARLLEECYASSEPGVELGARAVLGGLIAALSSSGALGGAPFFPGALRAAVAAEAEEEGPGSLVAAVQRQVEGALQG